MPIEANALALEALRKSLSKEYLNMISHCDSAFAVEHLDLSKASINCQSKWRRNLVEKSPTNVAS